MLRHKEYSAGLDRATELVVTGGSAGGLSTFLHVDRIAGEKTARFVHFLLKMIILPRQARDKHRESTQKRRRFLAARMKASAPSCDLVTAAPVVGYFLDHANWAQLHPPAPPPASHSTQVMYLLR